MHQLRDPLPRPPGGGARLNKGAPRVRLLVCGEPARGDDGVAPLAVEAALARLPAAIRQRIEVRRRAGLDPVDLLGLPAGTGLLVVDCVVGVPPGHLVRLPLETLGRGGPTPASSHTLPLGDVVALVETLDEGRPSGVFLGLGGAHFELGAPLSAPVAEARGLLEEAIATELRRLLAPG